MTTSITTRAGKGSPLTHDEVDANFTNLQTTADAALPLAGGTLTGPVTMTGGTVTTSAPLIDASQTWNAAGVTFTGLKLNITNTASASGSKLVDWQVGGSSVQYIDKNGATFFLGGSVSAPSINISGGGITSGFWNRGAYDIGVSHNGKLTHRFANTAIRCYDSNENQQLLIDGQQTLIKFGPSEDAGVARNAAGVVEVNSGSVGTFRDLKVRNLLAGGGNGSYVQTPSMTVANLASAATAGAGARAFVTDATATTFMSTVAGGGSNKVPVVSDGTNWLIG